MTINLDYNIEKSFNFQNIQRIVKEERIQTRRQINLIDVIEKIINETTIGM